jgi:hypothetical protein
VSGITTRAIWPLLKARVIERSETHCVIAFGSEYGSPTRIHIPCDMRRYDIRDGDLLTLYTEVLLAKPQEMN